LSHPYFLGQNSHCRPRVSNLTCQPSGAGVTLDDAGWARIEAAVERMAGRAYAV